MPDKLEDTRPRPVVVNNTRGEVPAPPKFLLWGIIGLFVLAIIGSLGVVIVFRNVLEPAQQERVLGVLPFMEAFLPPRPSANDTLPTLQPNVTSDISAQDLLNRSFDSTETPTPTIEEQVVTEEATSAAIVATETATTAPTLAPTATPEPTVEQQIVPTQAAVNTSTRMQIQPSALLTGINYQKQGWNECGPANITMALSYYGWQNNKDYAAQYLKWGREDKNVSPSEMVDFVNTYSQVKALTRIGGDIQLVKTLIANGFPVVIETSYMFEGWDWIGHYRTIIGYDDTNSVFTIDDSFIGSSIQETYADVDKYWRHFNRRFIVLYTPQDESLVSQILGVLADPDQAAQHAYDVANAEANKDPNDPFTWYNMGSSLAALGDYEFAAAAYDLARQQQNPDLPFRVLWYQFGMFEAYYEVGRYHDVVSLAEANLDMSGNYVEEIYFWYGKGLAAQGKTSEATSAYRNALRLRSDYLDAQVALDELTRS